jgi:hypothetical protein
MVQPYTLPDAVVARLQVAAELKGVPSEQLLGSIFQDMIEDLEAMIEDEEDRQLVLEARAEGGPTITLEELKLELGLDD